MGYPLKLKGVAASQEQLRKREVTEWKKGRRGKLWRTDRNRQRQLPEKKVRNGKGNVRNQRLKEKRPAKRSLLRNKKDQ